MSDLTREIAERALHEAAFLDGVYQADSAAVLEDDGSYRGTIDTDDGGTIEIIVREVAE